MRLLFFVISLAAAAMSGQEPTAERHRILADWERLARIAEEQRIEASRAAWTQQILERHAVEEQRREVIRKANQFVEVWNRVMAQYREGVLNVKEVRALSKAFRAFENSGFGK